MAEQTPNIRFRGFDNEWEHHTIRDMTSELCEYATLNSAYPLLTSSRTGLMFQNEYRSNNSTDNGNTLFSVVPYGKCTYRHMSDDDIFHFNINTIAEKGLVSKEYPVFDGTEDNDISFIVSYLNSSDSFRAFCREKKTGGTRTRLYYKSLCKFAIICPDLKEQKRISSFLECFDALINQKESKYEKLRNLKNAMLEKMFPKDGADVPEIRFTGFTDTWELCRFDSLYKKVTEKNDLSYRSDKIISVANMYFKPDTILSKEEYLKTYNVFKLGDIAFEGNKNKSFAHGRFVENTIGDGIVSHVFDVFRPIMNDYDLLFWKYAINNENLMKHILIRCTKASTMMTNLVSSEFLKEYFRVPQVKEQKKIGQYLSLIDARITICQSELEKFKNLKKAFLEKIFI